MPCKIVVDNIKVHEEKGIANEFNNFFIDLGPELAKEIPGPAKSFKSYVLESNSTMRTGPISVNELKNTFFSIKTNRCPRPDEINFNVVISVPPCFSRIPECVMYNHLCKFLLDTNIFYKKQFGFQEALSTDHVILQLVDQIHNDFEQNNFILGVSIQSVRHCRSQHTT